MVFCLFTGRHRVISFNLNPAPMKPQLLLFTCSILFSMNIAAQPDLVATDNGPLKISPIFHASMVLEWNGKTIYVDPYGGAERFSEFSAPDLVLITDIHGDHLDENTLGGIDLANADLIAPKAVMEKMSNELHFKKTTTLGNGESANWESIKIEAIPMYNLPESKDAPHPKGRGNGYVLNIGGKRIYISGDTEGIPEMRALKNIDVAFVCMNLPYTMDVSQAAAAVLDFKPKIVYPFHYRGGGNKFSDIEKFKTLVNDKDKNIEVRLRNWYPEK